MRASSRLPLVALALALALALPVSALAQRQNAARQPAGRAPVVRRFDPKKPALPPGHLVTIKSNEHLQEYIFDQNGSYTSGRYGTDWEHMSLQQYTDLRNAAVALMNKYPPDRHVYVGLGRDPAPFIAFMEEIGADALNFPASGVGWTQNATLDEHFEQLIPAHLRNGQKTLVLIDQTTSGKTLAAAAPLFKGYLQRTGGTAPVKAVAFTMKAQLNADAQREGVEVMDTRPFPEVNRFFYAPYEGVISPYDRHTPHTQTVSQIVWRPQYQQFKDALRQRIERDQELDGFLSRLTGDAGGAP